MKILKVINNNVVSACDDKGKEIVVMGKGLGFGKKNGDILDESKIEKKFSMPDESVSRLEEILKDIPYEYAQVANRIIAMVKEKFDMKLSKIIYITLTDHLNFAITRFKKGIKVENALLWEIKRFYQKEFEAGKEALEIIKKNLGLSFQKMRQDFLQSIY
ncbi:MAG: CAT RNA binding domain-containing protein [Butyribacter sp.]